MLLHPGARRWHPPTLALPRDSSRPGRPSTPRWKLPRTRSPSRARDLLGSSRGLVTCSRSLLYKANRRPGWTVGQFSQSRLAVVPPAGQRPRPGLSQGPHATARSRSSCSVPRIMLEGGRHRGLAGDRHFELERCCVPFAPSYVACNSDEDAGLCLQTKASAAFPWVVEHLIRLTARSPLYGRIHNSAGPRTGP